MKTELKNIFVNSIPFKSISSDLSQLKVEISELKDGDIFERLTKFDIFKFDICILNGFCISDNFEINEGDNVVFIKRGVMPELKELKSMIEARNSPELNLALRDAVVGIAGVGGLGSNIALSLARVGVSKLVLADFDIVEPSNLNRQQYFVRHIGSKKVQALKELIKETNPFVDVEIFDGYLDSENVGKIFKDCMIVCEAFDNQKSKAMIANEAAVSLKGKKIILASGMAGLHSSNLIKTQKFANNVYICGDLVNGAKIGEGLMAARVAICANHQANLALRLLMGLDI